MSTKIALLGFGAIGREVCNLIDTIPEVSVSQVLVRAERKVILQAQMPPDMQAICSVDALHADVDFVLECAGHQAVISHCADILRKGIDVGLLSVGALATVGEPERLRHIARSSGARLVIVPGAIGGMDALAAAAPALSRVDYTARKPPLSWQGSPAENSHDLATIDAPTVVFAGSAREAALAFPKNANVVATVALAGIGFDKTNVTLIADPAATGNSHHLKASGGGVALDYTTQSSALPDNPKTSALTVLSAVRSLRGQGAGLVV